MNKNLEIILLIILSFLTNCLTKQKEIVKEPFCDTFLMQAANYEQGNDTLIPNIKNIKNNFSIIIDTSFKANNYISIDEYLVAKESEKLDSTRIEKDSVWNTLTLKQKLKRMKVYQKERKSQIKTIHEEYNDGKQIIWIINNSFNDTMILQVKLFDFFCVLQAKNISDQWKSIEYITPVFDNFCYHYLEILPKRATFFKAEIPDTGNFETKLRFAILGLDTVYYSNEIIGKIDYCQFNCDSNINKLYKLERYEKIVDWDYKGR